jgi:hypothetical protein
MENNMIGSFFCSKIKGLFNRNVHEEQEVIIITENNETNEIGEFLNGESGKISGLFSSNSTADLRYIWIYPTAVLALLSLLSTGVSWLWEDRNQHEQVKILEIIAALSGGGAGGGVAFGGVFEVYLRFILPKQRAGDESQPLMFVSWNENKINSSDYGTNTFTA